MIEETELMGQRSLSGETALITGGAKRIGKAVAGALAGEGVNIALHYHTSSQAAASVCAELRELGVEAWPVQADLSSPQQAESLLEQAVCAAGPIHILVNNASLFDPSSLCDVGLEQVSANTAVNAWAPFALSRAMAAQGVRGHIVNLLDTRLVGYDFTHVAYILSKHMLGILTRMTALEYAPLISVNAVSPGLILPPPGEDLEYLRQRAESLPLKRHGDAEDIVAAVMFLLESTFTTGQVIHVDGGRHLRGD